MYVEFQLWIAFQKFFTLSLIPKIKWIHIAYLLKSSQPFQTPRARINRNFTNLIFIINTHIIRARLEITQIPPRLDTKRATARVPLRERERERKKNPNKKRSRSRTRAPRFIHTHTHTGDQGWCAQLRRNARRRRVLDCSRVVVAVEVEWSGKRTSFSSPSLCTRERLRVRVIAECRGMCGRGRRTRTLGLAVYVRWSARVGCRLCSWYRLNSVGWFFTSERQVRGLAGV